MMFCVCVVRVALSVVCRSSLGAVHCLLSVVCCRVVSYDFCRLLYVVNCFVMLGVRCASCGLGCLLLRVVCCLLAAAG